MREFRPYGSVRGAFSNGRPYRDMDVDGREWHMRTVTVVRCLRVSS